MKITTEGKITEKSEPRRVRTRYGLRSVADVTLEDGTGARVLFPSCGELRSMNPTIVLGKPRIHRFISNLWLTRR